MSDIRNYPPKSRFPESADDIRISAREAQYDEFESETRRILFARLANSAAHMNLGS